MPICIECSEAHAVTLQRASTPDQIRAILMKGVLIATARANAASDAFNAIMGHFPSGLPHPDGIQRIHNVSRALTVARREMLEAHTRLSDFLDRGVVPEDLKKVQEQPPTKKSF